ncbi:hypothetical protein FG382_00300 [Psychrobacillus lasiicapitis]|uniref:DUF3953 domain-containing protein n=1 Tax=Psychrobacillus lasiicapitis TaxID=1636719 RepID=A0A544TGQ8_9BACI|nr:hypothetical protein FG382_00300 [Psychrobacillus lasiicapitis]GGA28417.1 hypothetical protein GCM10011384_17270 [Psychrobacillus lasiicapitis]
MKRFSLISIFFMLLGLLSFTVNWIIEGYFEPLILTGFIFILIGALFCFIAIFKKEAGSIKFITLTSFFVILFLVVWFEPFQVLRMMTWLKNVI